MKKRLIALLLALTMVVSILPISAFAAEEEEKLNYVSLGASNVNGYGMHGYLIEDVYEYPFLKENENIYGYKQDTPGSYPVLIKEHLESKGYTVNLSQMAISSMRAEEVRFLLDDSYSGDAYTDWRFCDVPGYDAKDSQNWFYLAGKLEWKAQGNAGDPTQEQAVAALKAAYKKAIIEADLITVDIGINNFGVYASNQIVSNMYENDLNKVDPELAAIYAEGKAYVMDVLQEEAGDLLASMPVESLNHMADTMAYALVGFCLSFDAVMEQIYTLNPDATVAVVSIQNLMYGLFATMEGIEETLPFGDIFGALVNAANVYTASISPYCDKYVYADVRQNGHVEFFSDELLAYNGDPSTLSQDMKDCFDVYDNDLYIKSRVQQLLAKQLYAAGLLDISAAVAMGGDIAENLEYFAIAYQNDLLTIPALGNITLKQFFDAGAAGRLPATAQPHYDGYVVALNTAYDLMAEIMQAGVAIDTLDAASFGLKFDPVEDALLGAFFGTLEDAVEKSIADPTFKFDLNDYYPEGIYKTLAAQAGMPEGFVNTVAVMGIRTGIGNSFYGHPNGNGQIQLKDAIVNALENGIKGKEIVFEEAWTIIQEYYYFLEEMFPEYYDEAYAYGYTYAAENGYIAMAQKGIADAIAAIEAIDLDDTDMTEEFKAQLQVELDALVVTLEKMNAALAAGQFATVDSLVATFMALENDLYTHLDNIKYISQQAGSDVYTLVVLPAIDYINTVTIPNAKLAVQAVLDQAWQYIITKIYEAYGILIDINTSVTDMIDMVQTCIAKKIAEAMGIVVDTNATIQDTINAIRDHIAHITAGEIELTEDFFYLAIEDSDFYAELVAEALKLSEDQYMEVTLDEVTPELLARADFITIGYNNMNSLYFGLYQIMGVANVYLQDAYEFIYTVDAKFDAAYPGMANMGIDLYTLAMDALYEQGGIYLWLVEGMEVTELNWEALVGAENLPYIEEARAQMQAALIEAGVPATYPVSVDVVAEVLKMTKDYAPLDENALRNALGEHAVFSLDIPVADLAVFAVESVLYDYIAYNQNYANTMMMINAINPEATVAALGNYSRLDLDYEFVIDEISFVPAEVLAQFGFEGFELPAEAKDALAAVAALGIYEIDISTTEALETLLGKYSELAQYAVSFELPSCEEAELLIADLIETANAIVDYAAGQIDDVYTVTIPVADLMNMAVEHGQQLDVLINASLNTEVVIASQTIQVNDILALLANLSSLHPFSYASAFGNVFYVDITGAQMGGMEYIADQILNALTITCAHADNDKDHYCDLYCGEKLTECADEDTDHYCDVCGAELSKCADENTDHYCDVCGAELSKCSDAQNDGDHDCDYCGNPNVTAHRYSAATCTSPSRCVECGAIGGTAAHTEQIIPAVDATCTATGLTEGKKCSVCGEILVAQEEVPVLAHTEEVIPAVNATCTATGLTEGKKCSVCGEILAAQETVEKLAHTEEVIPAVNATCTATGLTEGKKCSVCGEILVAQETVAAKGHTFGEWSVSKEATRQEAGEETRSCTCGETETREIPALGGANVGVIVGCSVGGVGILAVIVFFLLKKKKLF